MPLQPGSHEAGGGVDDQPEPAERATCPRSARRCRRGARPTRACGPRQNSPGWMTNGSSSVDRDLLGEVRRAGRAGRSPGAVVVEDAERVAEPQVDARRLHQRRVPRVDPDAARLDEPADRAVGEDGGRRSRREVCSGANGASGASARAARAGRAAGGSGAGSPCGPRRGGAGRRARCGGCGGVPPSPPSALLVLVGRLLDRPPDDVQQQRRAGSSAPA